MLTLHSETEKKGKSGKKFEARKLTKQAQISKKNHSLFV